MRVFQFFVTSICAFWFVNFSIGQPQQDSKKVIEGVTVYKDAKNPRLYYYEPGELTLGKKPEGTPDFQFLDLRYTGTKCNNDIGLKNFTSLVQFSVEMQKTPKEKLTLIKRKLRNAKLKPLPISAIATRLILPRATSEDSNYKPIGTEGSTQANTKDGYNSSSAYWSKRYFTTRLTNYESQLLNKQLREGQLGLNLSYSYYVRMIPPKEGIAQGSEELTGIVEETDSIPEEEQLKNVLINSNTISIEVDLEEYPEAIKQIDLNEGIPPSYAAIEVKCYDFSKELRPDLFLKTVEIEAISVDKNKPVTINVRFTTKDTDIFTRYINFPYAVQMDKPMRYRISEISNKGVSQTFEWIAKPDCTTVIDISTKESEQTTETFTLDVEINEELLANEDAETIELVFQFIKNGKTAQETIQFEPEDTLLKTLIFEKDKNTEVVYYIAESNPDENSLEPEQKTLNDTYVYINSL